MVEEALLPMGTRRENCSRQTELQDSNPAGQFELGRACHEEVQVIWHEHLTSDSDVEAFGICTKRAAELIVNGDVGEERFPAARAQCDKPKGSIEFLEDVLKPWGTPGHELIQTLANCRAR